MLETVKKGFNYVLDYLKANLTMAIIIGAVAALVLIALIAIVCKAVKNAKNKKKAKLAPVANAQSAPVLQQTAPVVAVKSDEQKQAEREATLKRLEEERIAAEKEEEQERLAKEREEKAKLAKEAQETKKVSKPTPTVKKTTVTPVKTANNTSKTATKATPKTKASSSDENNKYAGKWSIFHLVTKSANGDVEEEAYFFELRASNGEKLLSSEEYTSHSGALKGIETHKSNIEKGNFKITLSKKGDYIFKLLSGKNTLLCTGENYKTQARCESAIESTKRFAQTAVVDDKVQEKVVKIPVEDDSEVVPEYPDYINGKWIVVSRKGANGEDLFYFELYANNGEKLLSSEEYTSYIGAVNGIQTHKTNIEKDHFRIALTKKGDYIFKLLNGNGQLLCLGEHYKTKRRCESAVESVKRFAKNSPVLTDPEHTK